MNQAVPNRLKRKPKPRDYWTLDKIKKEIVDNGYIKLSELRNNSPHIYSAAQKLGINAEMLGLKRSVYPESHWTIDNIKKYITDNGLTTLVELNKRHSRLCVIAKKQDITPEMLGLKRGKVQNGYWKDKNKIIELAKKYEYLKDFRENDYNAYRAAIKLNLIAFLQKKYFKANYGHRYKRKIYTILFSDNSIYIGISYNPNKRIEKHKKFSYFKNKFKKEYQLKISNKFFSPIEAQIEEKRLIEKYRKTRRFIILNKANGGQLGGNAIKWTKEAILKEMSKYSTVTEFTRKSSGAYQAAIAMGLKDLIYKKLNRLMRPHGYWTKENLKREAKKYKRFEDFRKNCGSAYTISRNLGILSEITSHMKRDRNPNNFWTKEKIIEEANKYETLIEFIRKSPVANFAAKKMGIISEVTAHMRRNQRWSKQKIIEQVMQLCSRKEFARSTALYQAAYKEKMISDIFQYYEDLKSMEILEEKKLEV